MIRGQQINNPSGSTLTQHDLRVIISTVLFVWGREHLPLFVLFDFITTRFFPLWGTNGNLSKMDWPLLKYQEVTGWCTNICSISQSVNIQALLVGPQ